MVEKSDFFGKNSIFHVISSLETMELWFKMYCDNNTCTDVSIDNNKKNNNNNNTAVGEKRRSTMGVNKCQQPQQQQQCVIINVHYQVSKN